MQRLPLRSSPAMSKKRMMFLERIKASNRGFGGKGAQPLSPELDFKERLDREMLLKSELKSILFEELVI